MWKDTVRKQVLLPQGRSAWVWWGALLVLLILLIAAGWGLFAWHHSP